MGEDLSSERSHPSDSEERYNLRQSRLMHRGKNEIGFTAEKRLEVFVSSLSPISYIIIARFFALFKGIRQFFGLILLIFC